MDEREKDRTDLNVCAARWIRVVAAEFHFLDMLELYFAQ
jgi:hypothetical protein